MAEMTSRDRLLTALNHREPDRIPLDIGSTQVTGIAIRAYERLREHLGLPGVEVNNCDTIQQIALPDADFVARWGIDVLGLYPLNAHNWNVVNEDDGEYWAYRDEWGIKYHFPKENGLYYSVVESPIGGMMTSPDEINAYPWPDTGDPRRIAGLRDLAESYRAQGKAVMIKGVLAGIFEMAQRIRGMQNCLIDLLTDEASTEALFDKLLQLKLDFWEMALGELGDVVDVISEADDFGTQTSQLMSPELFRKLAKPRLRTLFDGIKRLAPHTKLFFHSCGSVRALLPDFIEVGVDILNPIHVTAVGMEPVALKRDFGDDIVFWGGGVDTQGILPNGTPDEVRDDVRRNLDALAPGGGYVFSTVHNIQADVPPENLAAMWETLREHGY